VPGSQRPADLGRTLGRAGLIALVWASAVLGRPAAADEWTLQTGIHLDAWSGEGQDGRQILAPFALGFQAPRWGVGLRGAYGNAETDPGGSVTGFVDTTLSGHVRLTVKEIEIRLGLDLDLPTGVSRLKASQVAAFADEDLVALDRFGEGFDVNPTVLAYRGFGGAGVGVGVGYLRTGEYDPTRDTPGDDLDPGDEITVAVLGDAYVGDVIRVIGRASYTAFTTDRQGGRQTFRQGDELDFRVSVEWRPEPWFAELTLRDLVRFKAERPDAGGGLGTEPRNSSGNDFRAALTAGYILTDAWTLQGTAAVRHVSANDYPSADPLHDGGRTKVAVGPAVVWSPTRTFAVDAGVAYFVLDARRSPIFPRGGTFHGVHAALQVTYRF
jgi:hypothetical protein